MLVLSVPCREFIMIGDQIKVTVLKIRGKKQVRLGIEAPKCIPVHRRKVYEAIKSRELEEEEIEPIALC